MPSNLPPGVSVGMLPGNRPEDDEEDAFWDSLVQKLTEEEAALVWPPDGSEPSVLHAVISKARDLGLDAGRYAERAEAQIEAAMTPNPTFTDDELAALARMLGGDLFREDLHERAAVQKILAANVARDPDSPF